ncbi:MAG: hypothetical protein M1816_003898 [Peltula sp. TS41687]|nr:MAG: hypothetical protein M1816_003898 [Peltula sp. TS41687]
MNGIEEELTQPEAQYRFTSPESAALRMDGTGEELTYSEAQQFSVFTEPNSHMNRREMMIEAPGQETPGQKQAMPLDQQRNESVTTMVLQSSSNIKSGTSSQNQTGSEWAVMPQPNLGVCVRKFENNEPSGRFEASLDELRSAMEHNQYIFGIDGKTAPADLLRL